MRKPVKLVLCLLCLPPWTAGVMAGDLAGAVAKEPPRWINTGPRMSTENYHRSVLNNQRLVRGQLQSYSRALLDRGGQLGRAVGLLGAAVSVSTGDARYHLNDSRTLDMVFKDSIDDERSVVIEFKVSW